VSIEAAEEAQLNERVAQTDVLVTKSEIETAKAKADDARAQVQFETTVLQQHELRAPFGGVVALRAKELGSVLAAGESLFTLVAPDTVWVLAYVDEARAGDIRVGQSAEIRLRSLPQHSFEGRVTRIGIESDRVNEERKIYVSCGTCPDAFFLGEQAEVLITTAVLERALLVPEAAIERYDGMTGTLWIVADGQLQQRQSRFGRRTLDGRVEMLDGLPAGVGVPAAASSGFREGRSANVRAGSAR
jgi:HlyD family secretion protein